MTFKKDVSKKVQQEIDECSKCTALILDLRGKLVSVEPSNPKVDNVKEALKSLGYSNVELKKLDKFLMDNIELPIEQLIKMALKKMI